MYQQALFGAKCDTKEKQADMPATVGVQSYLLLCLYVHT